MLLVMGRALYKEWLDKDKLVLLQGWKRAGLTDVQISQNMGVSVFTLDKWKRNYSQIRQALKRGRSEINYIVENVLLKKALEGNVTAMIFFLKNNWRDKYNDSQLSKEERELVLANIQ
ncbi:MAG: small terminase subunit, partial [Lactobacillus iners]|nr:small terminase subunit [Lactobacillus iners]MCT7707664.1 small terminase subunit [Lactobacillus iners]